MELVDGCSLAELLRDGGRLSLAAIAAVAAPLADGLHAVHEATEEDGTPLGIVHRDVSPQNVLVDRAGSVKLIDFGVSTLSAGQQSTVTGFLKGKLRYMPPEQAHGRRLDRRADVYAFGIVLWELLTGRVLFDADNEFELLDQVRAAQAPAPSSIAPGLPASLDAIVARALAADPDARFATMAELRDELARALPRPDARALAARVVEVANRDREPTEEPATALASPVALAARRSSRARVVALSSAAAIAALVGLWATIRTSPRPAVATEPAPAPVVAVPPPAPAVAPVPAPPPVARRPATRPPRARSAPPAPERVKSRSPYPLVDDPF
jgi:serine/threonine-protein kinase